MAKRRIKENLISYALILPAALLLIIFVFRPIVYSLILSLQKYRLGFNIRSFIWLDNYNSLFLSADFWKSLARTFTYSIYMVVISIAAGLFLAVIIMEIKKAVTLWQIVFFLPVAATMAAMAVVWRFILDNNFGILNTLLRTFGYPTANWLKDPKTAMGAVIVISIWSNAGYAMIFFMAGLANIPSSLYQAASLDGTNRIQGFRYITWPLLSPTTLFIVIIMTKRALSSFDTIKVMTNGGPMNTTQVLSLLLYQEAFQFFNIGYASAIAIIFFILVLLLALIQLKFEKRVFYR
jgi:multiple sugar transport system permease protein